MRSRRRIGLGLVASGVVHAAAAAAIWLHSAREQPEEERPPPEPEPVEIEFIEERGGAGTSGTGSGSTSAVARVETTTRRSRIETAPEPSSAEPSSSSLRMRTPPSTNPRLDPRRAATAIVEDPGPPDMTPRGPLDPPRPRKPPRIRSELRPDGPGGYETDDGTFVARTGRDGRVTMRDRSSFNVDLPRPRQLVKDMARGLERWADDPGRYAADTSNETRPTIGGRFELSDAITRLAGEDPYAARKLAFLERTRGERMKMAAGEKSERLREARRETWGRLTHLWRGPGTAADKRQLLFMMWDECAESGSAEVVDTARAVRGTIVTFIERRLPAGGRDAYTAEELARYNARRTSTERFAPYAASPPDR